MTGAAAGGFYFVDDSGAQLIKITPDGVNASTVIVGTMSGTNFSASAASSPFVWGTTLHVLNQDRLYTVNETDASLTLLGTVTGLPDDFQRFTGAVAPVTVVPEPTLFAIAAVAGLGFAAARGAGLRQQWCQPPK